MSFFICYLDCYYAIVSCGVYILVDMEEEQIVPVADNTEMAPAGSGREDASVWSRIVPLLLLLVLLLGAYFRFVGLDWDEGHHLHPDERFLTDVASQLETTADPLTYLRTSESPLNPYNIGKPSYVYGNFPMTVTRYVAEAVEGICGGLGDVCAYDFTAYTGIHLVGRVLSGLIDLVSVLFIFLIGRHLYGRRVGLLAALLLALAVMPIQQSHFFTMDNWTAGLTTVTVYMAVRAAESGEQKRWWALFGLFLGLAVASRINVAPLAAVAVVAGIVWLARRERRAPQQQGWRYLLTPQGGINLQRVVLGVLLAAAISMLAFRLAQPYAFADSTIVRETALAETGQELPALRVALQSVLGFNPQWVGNMEEIQGLQSPEATFPPALQWTARTPLLFPLTNMILYGMGLAAGLLAWAGFCWALWRIVRARPDWTAHAIPVAWSGAYFLFMGTRWVKSIRYFLPIYPFLLLLGAWALVALWQRAGQARGKRLAVGALGTLVVGATFLWANAFVDIYREPMTRLAASRWMLENIPTGATLLYEVEGETEELQLPLKGYEFQPGGFPLNLNFSLPEGGTVTGVRFNYLSAPGGTPTSAGLEVSVSPAAGEPLVSTTREFELDQTRRQVLFELEPETLAAETPYVLQANLAAGSAPVVAGTSRIANEEWDDLLPVSVDGRPAYASYYTEVTGGQRPVPWPATEEKRRLMLEWIEEADVIAISSQRSLWNTPRLPLSYPLNIAYYRSLFNGELGFELAAEFHADLNIGPLHISDTGAEVAWGHYPEIGWPPPGELAAEEAFSVYDHPPVWIFRKTDDYTRERAVQILGSVDLDKVIHMNPGEATRSPNGLMLTARERALQRAGGTFGEIFNLDGILNRSPAVAAVVWWLSLILLGWLTFPVAFVVFRGLPGRGYALARALSLLYLSWFGWFVASYGLLPHTRVTLLLGVLLLGVLSVFIFWRRRQPMAAWVRENWQYIVIVEGVSLLLFLIMIVIRLGNPDVWDVIWGGEKPMDLAYFTAVLKSTTFPPYDPWYAGGYINYYYYGFVYVGALTKLLGVVPATAYNLILPMLFSFTGMGVFSIAYNLVKSLEIGDWRLEIGRSNLKSLISRLKSRAVVAGLTAVLLAVLLGNLAELGVMAGAWQRASDSEIDTGIPLVDTAVRTVDGALAVTLGGEEAPIYPGDWFWTATRTINAREGEVVPISEFPFFTFLYGDLHAHMIALPLTMLALAWAVSLVLASEKPGFSENDGPRNGLAKKTGFLGVALFWFTGALAIGVLRPTNTWDWPTYLFLGILAVIYHAYRRRGLSLSMVGQGLLQVVALAALSTLLFWPFIANYGTGYQSFRLWEGSYTYVGNYLVIHGLFLFLALTHLAREFRAWSRSWTQEKLAELQPAARPALVLMVAYVPLLLALMFRGYWIAPVVLTLILFAGVLGLRPGLPAARRVLLILIASALGLTLLVEVVVLEGDIGRMNTVFKFYMQVWLMLSIAGGAALALAWPSISRRWPLTRRRAWLIVLALLIGAAALYPLLATPAKWRVRMSEEAPTTLDGMAFMKTTSYADAALDGSSQTIELADEYAALRWLQRNVEGSPVIAEATPPNVGEAYRSIGSRVAVYTGLPTILGWDWHQQQQRAALPDARIRDRMNDVATLYNTTDPEQALALLEEYDVRYIYVGSQEWLYYRPEGLRKFDEMVAAGMLHQVFRNPSVTVYRVRD